MCTTALYVKQNSTFMLSADLLGMHRAEFGGSLPVFFYCLPEGTIGHPSILDEDIHSRRISIAIFGISPLFCPLSLSLSSGIVCPSSDISRGFFRLSLPSFRFPEDKKRQWFFGEIGGNPTHSWFDLVSKERE